MVAGSNPAIPTAVWCPGGHGGLINRFKVGSIPITATMDYPFDVYVEVSYEYRLVIFAESREGAKQISRELGSELESWGYIPDYDVYIRDMDKKNVSSLLQSAEADDIMAFKDGEWMSPKQAFSDEVVRVEIPGQQRLV